jgi:hypothetical protein
MWGRLGSGLNGTNAQIPARPLNSRLDAASRDVANKSRAFAQMASGVRSCSRPRIAGTGKDPMAESADDAEVRFQRTLIVDSKFASRMTAATLRYVLLTPWRIVRIALLSLFIAIIITFGVARGETASVGIFIVALLALPVFYLLVFLIAYFPARRQINSRLPVGSEYSIVMWDDSFRLKDPLVATDVSYQLYKSLRTSRDVVSLMPRRGRRPTIVPRELFTTESLGWLASRLSALQ